MKKAGFICKDDRFYYIAYHDEQRNEFKDLNKVLVRVYEDRFLQKPVLNENKTEKIILKDVKLLKVIGFLN